MAAINKAEQTLTIIAAAAIAQYQAVQASGAPATAGGNALGFATTAAASGAAVGVVNLGTALAVAGGAIAPGAAVEVGATVTKVVTKSAGVTVGRYLGATAAADGDVIEVHLIPN